MSNLILQICGLVWRDLMPVRVNYRKRLNSLGKVKVSTEQRQTNTRRGTLS